jgi:hypothetical protein
MFVTEPPTNSGVARVLVAMPDLCARLIEAHVTDGRGRCQACTRGGTGEPGASWPCSIRDAAMAASMLRATGRCA